MADLRINLERGGQLLAGTREQPDRIELSLQLEGVTEPCILHWGLAQSSRRWVVPPQSVWPAGSRAANSAAVETPFPAPPNLTISFARSPEYGALDFVLFFPASGRWDNNHGRDYHLPIGRLEAATPEIAHKIIEGETGRHSWTLMHRFNLCHDLLDWIQPGDIDGLALVFVWLRFSAIRQLDWQRDYNTKPRELAHAQDRLTLKLAARFAGRRDERPWLRLIMTTIGRGGEGQRVRDEVLNIMHRHHIKEVSGHFMEEWHQKLHNNTTPDDVVICEAYLAFLRSNGDRNVFYRTLEAGGVSRARLQSYERPIRSDPDFIPDLKHALIHDFEQFLHILKRLHSGTDLGASVHDARPVLAPQVVGLVDWIATHQGDAGVALDVLAGRIAEARSAISDHLASDRASERLRALVYLDVALEELLRLSIERRLHALQDVGELVNVIAQALRNLTLTDDEAEFAACLRYWERLRASPRDSAWALRVDAGIERSGRAATTVLGACQRVLQPKAEMLGRAFGAEPWTITAFSEEVIRGRAAVMLPVLARLLRRLLRRDYRLPPWQIVSGGRASGELRTVNTLASVQETRFARPTILLAADVGGQEEVPIGVTAVITPREVDILSHVGIRARNAGVLFLTCDDAGEIEHLMALAGRQVTISVQAGGNVSIEPGAGPPGEGVHSTPPTDARPDAVARQAGTTAATTLQYLRGSIGAGTRYALQEREFAPEEVGSKALNLARLDRKLPKWIHRPRSVAIPFGVFERTLTEPLNTDTARRYHELVGRLKSLPVEDVDGRRRTLESLRAAINALAVPHDFVPAVRGAMEEAGLAWPDPDRAWSCIRQVWASKWNERAFLSREANGIAHEAVLMAVLIQPVIEADYAFVIHTVNPTTGASHEIYAEMVLGLGEALVGAHPGKAASFTWDKNTARLDLLGLPSKSHGLFGGGLIFRSDSNAEDAPQYAGAGLYDSVMLHQPREAVLDYSDERLVWDDEFRRRTAATVAQIGVAVEQALGGAQDVEGACTRDEWYVLQARPQVGLKRE